MKNTHALLSLLIFFASCSKESVRKQSLSNKLKEIVQLQDPSVRIVAFNMLNPEEKVLLWKNHLSTFLDNKSLSIEQREFINYCADLLSPDFYDKKKAQFEGLLAEVNFRAKNLFNKNDYVSIFLGATRNGSGSINPLVTDPPTCNCIFTIYCEFTYGNGRYCFDNSTAKVCNQSNSGCGLFGTSPCTGVCVGPLS